MDDILNVDLKSFDSFLYSKMSETKLPSLSVAVIKDDEIFHSRTFGLKNIESSEPTSITTNYGIGSVTKSFTGLAIGKLVERRKIDFHDLVTDHPPELKITKSLKK